MKNVITNKKILVALLLVATVALLAVFAACNLLGCTVTFSCGAETTTQMVQPGSKVTLPTLAPQQGKFVTWYVDSACTTPVTESDLTISKSTTFYAKWQNIAVTGISATYTGGVIKINTQPSKEHFAVTLNYNDGTTAPADRFSVGLANTATVGTKQVPVLYALPQGGELQTTVDVVVEDLVLTGLSATYTGGTIRVDDKPSKYDMAVIATFDNGTTQTLVPANFEVEIDTSTDGIKTATISYTYGQVTKTATVNVEVIPKEVLLTEVTVEAKGVVFEGDEFGKDSIVVTAQFSNDTSQVLLANEYSLYPVSTQTPGVVNVVVSYSWKEQTKTGKLELQVVELVLSRIETNYNGGVILYGGQPLREDITVTAHFKAKGGAEEVRTKVVTDYVLKAADTNGSGQRQTEITYTWRDVTESGTITFQVKIPDTAQVDIHFLELGNQNTGDCVYIKAGAVDILIDAGSTKSSIETIQAYVNEYCTDGILEYVIATHAHEDHIAGLVGPKKGDVYDGIFNRYECQTIIEFAQTNNVGKELHSQYVLMRDLEVAAGANCYTALDCINGTNGAQKVFDLTGNGSVTLEVLNQRYYAEATDDENDYSVCVMLKQDNKNYLFTGDLEKNGEASLVELNPDLPKVELWKGGHHGSYTAASSVLMQKIQPKCVCICCCAGNVEYTQDLAKSFPAQEFINRVAPYTDEVYVTTLGKIKQGTNSKGETVWQNDGYQSFNGNILYSCKLDATTKQLVATVTGSNNSTKLKDTDWFKANRICPDAWK